MMLYRTTYQKENPETGLTTTYFRWDGSAKDAGANRKKMRQRHGFVPNSVQTAKIIVPTNKKDVIKFLNSEIFSNVHGLISDNSQS